MTGGSKWRLREWFPSLDDRAQERLRIYQLELVRWTKTINLISSSTVEEADLIHFADSIQGATLVLNDLGEGAKEVWDLGSGNGFPGVVLCILRPSLGVICLDSDERKVSFLKQLSLRFELENLGARCERIENIPSGSINFAVNRGLASITKTLVLSQKAMVPGGAIYHFKGPDWTREIGEVSGAQAAAWKSEVLGEYDLPEKPFGTTRRPARAIVKSVFRA